MVVKALGASRSLVKVMALGAGKSRSGWFWVYIYMDTFEPRGNA
jgi:hypothetical protein